MQIQFLCDSNSLNRTGNSFSSVMQTPSEPQDDYKFDRSGRCDIFGMDFSHAVVDPDDLSSSVPEREPPYRVQEKLDNICKYKKYVTTFRGWWVCFKPVFCSEHRRCPPMQPQSPPAPPPPLPSEHLLRLCLSRNRTAPRCYFAATSAIAMHWGARCSSIALATCILLILCCRFCSLCRTW